MTRNSIKNTALLIATAFLFIALFHRTLYNLPYGYFTLLRFVVTISAALVAWLAFKKMQTRQWIWPLGFIVILFNPIIPIHLTLSWWQIIDIVTGIFLLSCIWIIKLSQKQ